MRRAIYCSEVVGAPKRTLRSARMGMRRLRLSVRDRHLSECRYGHGTTTAGRRAARWLFLTQGRSCASKPRMDAGIPILRKEPFDDPAWLFELKYGISRDRRYDPLPDALRAVAWYAGGYRQKLAVHPHAGGADATCMMVAALPDSLTCDRGFSRHLRPIKKMMVIELRRQTRVQLHGEQPGESHFNCIRCIAVYRRSLCNGQRSRRQAGSPTTS
jgi:hypothetical protein